MAWKQYGSNWRSYHDSIVVGRFPLTVNYNKNIVKEEMVLLRTSLHYCQLPFKPGETFNPYLATFDFERIGYGEALEMGNLKPPEFPHLAAIMEQYQDYDTFKGLHGYSSDAHIGHVIAADIKPTKANYVGWSRDRKPYIGFDDPYNLQRWGCWWMGVTKGEGAG